MFRGVSIERTADYLTRVLDLSGIPDNMYGIPDIEKRPHYIQLRTPIMPSLITQRSNDKRPVPPCGRLIHYVEPHSPFQILVETKRREIHARQGLSNRELARRIGVSQSTLWIWLHNEAGYPSVRAFKPIHLQALCRELKIDEAEMQSATDASRHVFTARSNPTPQPMMDAFAAFIGVLTNDRRQSLKKASVVHLAKIFYNGAIAGKV